MDEKVAALAVAMAATDGSISRREIEVIKAFFFERAEMYDDSQERKDDVVRCMKDTMAMLQRGNSTKSIISSYCEEFLDAGDRECCFIAYNVCVDVAVADAKIEKRESNALRFIAQQLGLPDDEVQEVNDGKIAMAMYGDATIPSLSKLGVPRMLSLENQKQWLTVEYEKWRRRQSSATSSVAADASARIKMIMSCLAEIDEQLNKGAS